MVQKNLNTEKIAFSQVKSSLLYCQFFHTYSTYIQRIEIALLSDPWCIQLTLNTDSRRSNTDKYSLTICTYKLYRYTNEDIVEKKKFYICPNAILSNAYY